MNEKIVADYDWDPHTTATVDLALTSASKQPGDGEWRPALRDTIAGQRVVWARFEPRRGRQVLWVRDRAGARRLKTLTF